MPIKGYIMNIHNSSTLLYIYVTLVHSVFYLVYNYRIINYKNWEKEIHVNIYTIIYKNWKKKIYIYMFVYIISC